MKLSDFKKEYEKLSIKKNLVGKEALEAVKQNGYALQHVNSYFFDDDKADILIKRLTELGKIKDGKVLV